MDADAISDNNGGGIPNQPSYRDNRHDQSIWNLIVYKFGLKVRPKFMFIVLLLL